MVVVVVVGVVVFVAAGAGVFAVVVVFVVAGVGALGGVVALALAVVTLKLGTYDIIHPYNNYGVKLCAFFWRLCRFL